MNIWHSDDLAFMQSANIYEGQSPELHSADLKRVPHL